MKKQQAQQYFEHLKKIDQSNNLSLPSIISIITAGKITPLIFRQFVDHLKLNQFGEYNNIDQNVDKINWKTIDYQQFNQIVKALESYSLKLKPLQISPSKDQIKHKNQQQYQINGSSRLNKSHNNQEHPNQQNTLQQEQNRSQRHINQSLNDDKQMINLKTEFIKQQKLVEIKERYEILNVKILKKLLIVFDSYRKRRHLTNQSFQKNQNFAQHIDIHIFMMYCRYQLNKITNLFKVNATNRMWLNFHQFVTANMQIIGFKHQQSYQQKYWKLKDLKGLLDSQKIKKMVKSKENSNLKTKVSQHIQHTGAYKQDIIDHLQQMKKMRDYKLQARWSGKKLKTEKSHERSNIKIKQSSLGHQKISKSKTIASKSQSKLKTQGSPSIYQQLKLPKLRLKQYMNESIYKHLKRLETSNQQQKIKNLVNYYEHQQYLAQYLKQQQKQKEQLKKSKSKRSLELPLMKFT